MQEFHRSGVGAVTTAAGSKTLVRSRQAHRAADARSQAGTWRWPNRFSGMKWFVATVGMPMADAWRRTYRPTTKWDWTWTRSGRISSSNDATSLLTSHGKPMRNVGCTGVR